MSCRNDLAEGNVCRKPEKSLALDATQESQNDDSDENSEVISERKVQRLGNLDVMLEKQRESRNREIEILMKDEEFEDETQNDTQSGIRQPIRVRTELCRLYETNDIPTEPDQPTELAPDENNEVDLF
ncbi:hypothetical protein AB6A40_001420 [Gnathostoma spinigerum]|uniref:Uncharacterized protein n=1 Tax=Gnathostoma spinigerum TaxID=75299 RepID=A0ABD6EBC1_9BILA